MNYAMPDYLERGKKALQDCGLKGKDDEYICSFQVVKPIF